VEDVEDARELVEKRMREVGFEQAILDKVMDLLRRFDDDRERLFEEMLSRLEEPNTDGLRDRWSTNCQQAVALLERLESDIRSVLEDSEANALSADERWNAVGPKDLVAGERRAWAQVARLDVPDAAYLISKVLEADIAVIKSAEQELQKAKGSDLIVQKLLEQNFATVRDRFNRLRGKYVNLDSGLARLAALFMKDPGSKGAASEFAAAMEKASDEANQAGQLKRAARGVIVDCLKVIDGASAQLSEDNVLRLLARGVEAAGSWRSAGQTGDYRATDWDWMKDNAIKRGLVTRAEDAQEQSEQLFDELRPAMAEELEAAFEQLTDDPGLLQDMLDEGHAAYYTMDRILADEEAYIGTLADGGAKQQALSVVREVRDQIKLGWNLWFDRTKRANEDVKK
jgi:hypothetical protein